MLRVELMVNVTTIKEKGKEKRKRKTYEESLEKELRRPETN